MSARRGIGVRAPVAPVCCEECGTIHRATGCPECGNPPDGLMVGVLSTEVITLAGDRWAVEAERDGDSGGWVTTSARRLADADTGTRWESEP